MIYIVVSKGGGNHERVEAAFMSRELAEIWVLHNSSRMRLRLVEVQVMDGTPEMNRIVLENRK